MVYPTDAQSRQHLEQLYQKSPATPFHQQMVKFLKQIGAVLIYEMTRNSGEPRISRYRNVEGKALWHVYDPLTQASFTTSSEQEVRAWLEQRYSG